MRAVWLDSFLGMLCGVSVCKWYQPALAPSNVADPGLGGEANPMRKVISSSHRGGMRVS